MVIAPAGPGGPFVRVLIAASVFLPGLGQPAMAQGGDVWKRLEPLPVARRLLAAAAEDGKLYTFGGCGSPCFGPPAHTSTFEETLVEVYDPATRAWTDRGEIPEIFFGGAAAAPGNGRIYLVGGFLTGGRLLEYDPLHDTWQSRAPMPTPRHGLAAVALGGKVYTVGGSDGGAASGALEIYDPATDSWQRGPPMPTPRVFLGAAALGGKLYAVGGSPDCCGDSRTDAVEVYDPATDRWSTVAPLPIAEQASAVAAVGGRLFALGGFVPGEGVQEETFEYDPATDSWTLRVRAPMPTPRDQAPAVVLGGNVFVPGGSVDCHCQARDDFHCYTPPTDRFPVDLAITKTDHVQVVRTYDVLHYTITVTNVGLTDVPRARVTDEFPARLEDVTWTCTGDGGGVCTASGQGDVHDDQVELPVGGTVTYEVTAKVGPAASCPLPVRLVNTATVEPLGGLVDSNPGNDSATDEDGVAFVADLFVRVKPKPTVVKAGDPIEYGVEVGNHGPDAACGARLQVSFPSSIDGIAAVDGASAAGPSRAGGGRTSGKGQVRRVLDLLPDAPVIRPFAGTVPAIPTCPVLTRLVADATVAPHPGVADPRLENNSAWGAAARLTTVALEIGKDDGLESITGGEETTYGVTVENGGPDAACGARVRDPFPPELGAPVWTCTTSGGARCKPNGKGELDDRMVELPAGDEAHVTYEVTGTAVCTGAPALENTAVLEFPPGVARAQATDVDELLCPPKLSLTKTLTGSCVEGAQFRYTLELSNESPFPQGDNPGDELLDTLPPALTLLDATATSGDLVRSGNQVSWNGEVPGLGSVTFTLFAEIEPGTLGQIVCNQASVATDSVGDGINNAVLLSDDPALPGTADPTCFQVCPQVMVPIPALSPRALLLLALALAAAGCLALRRAGP